MSRYIWMEIDLKNNEEPLSTAYSRYELSQLCGVKEKTISQSMSRAKKYGWRCRYIKVMEEEQ